MSTSTLHPPRAGITPPERSAPRRGRWKWLVLAAVAAAFATLIVNRIVSAQEAGGRHRQMPPPSVATAAAGTGNLNVFLSALGSVTPLNTVVVRSRAVGELRKIHFTEGQFVRAGDLLAEVDPRAYQVALEQAEGQLARDQALLENARLDLKRYEDAQAAITQQQIDTAKSAVAGYEGAVRSDQGVVDNDRLQLSYCRITAPLSGRAGLKLVDEGNLIQTSDATGIVVLTQEQPMSVVFSLPEDNLPQIRRALAAGRKLAVLAYDRAGVELLATGEVSAIDNQIDPATGTVKLRALYPNDDHALFPNQFVNVRLLLATEEGVTLIPDSAIQIGAQSNSVFVVKPDGTVEQRSVTLGRSDGGRTAIRSGLQPGEIVAIDGLDKLQDGAKVAARLPAVVGAASPVADSDPHAGARAAARP